MTQIIGKHLSESIFRSRGMPMFAGCPAGSLSPQSDTDRHMPILRPWPGQMDSTNGDRPAALSTRTPTMRTAFGSD